MENFGDQRMRKMQRCLLKGRLIKVFMQTYQSRSQARLMMQTGFKSCRIKKPVAKVKYRSKVLINFLGFSFR